MEQQHFFFKAPSLLVISGQTGAGKSQLTAQIVKYRNELVRPAPQVVVWVYSIHQPALFQQLQQYAPDIIFCHGMEKFREINFSPKVTHMVVFDDMMSEIADSKSEGVKLFTQDVHHKNM